MKNMKMRSPNGGLISLQDVDTIYFHSERKSVIGKSGGQKGLLVFAFDAADENAEFFVDTVISNLSKTIHR